MAHGAYLMTGAPQAVMVHVNVGTANTINLLANAARDRVPLLLMAGRSPIMEARRVRGAQPADPLGAGDVRPGRHGARVRQVGLRAAQSRARPARSWRARWKRRWPRRAARCT